MQDKTNELTRARRLKQIPLRNLRHEHARRRVDPDGGGLAPSLQRLRQLAALLDAAHRSDLPAVQALHSSGALGAFRAAEVLSLYGALFAVQSAAARAFARELQAAAQAET